MEIASGGWSWYHATISKLPVGCQSCVDLHGAMVAIGSRPIKFPHGIASCSICMEIAVDSTLSFQPSDSCHCIVTKPLNGFQCNKPASHSR